MTIDLLAAGTAVSTRDHAQLLQLLLSASPTDFESSCSLAAMLLDGPAASPEPWPMRSPFADCTARCHEILAGTPTARAPREVPTTLDFIADMGGAGEWKADQLATRILLGTLPSRSSAAVVGTMRDDGIYLLEWLAHYRVMGFDHFFVYTNDNRDGSDVLLACLEGHGVLTAFNNAVSGAVPPEAKAFGHALNLVPELRAYEWALFVDSDEFLALPTPYEFSIRNFLDSLQRRFPSGDVAGVVFDWLWFISDNLYERRPGLLCERFQYARPHWLGKCLVRVHDVLSMRCQHYPELTAGRRFVDSALSPLEESGMWHRRTPEYRGGTLNHYWPKSFQEFAVKKARGATLGTDHEMYDRPYAKFFQWNGRESVDRFHPPSPEYVRAIHEEISRLRALPRVSELADRIDVGFAGLVNRICPSHQLRQLYRSSFCAEGPL